MFRQTAKPSDDLLCLPETVSAGDLPYLHRPEVVLRLLCRGVGGGLGGPAEEVQQEVQRPAAPRDEASPWPGLGQPALSGAGLSHPRWCLFYNPHYLNLGFFGNGFLRGHSRPLLCPAAPKPGGPVSVSRVPRSTAWLCSGLTPRPRAGINHSRWRLRRHKSRPVQSWSLPSRNVIARLSLRIN